MKKYILPLVLIGLVSCSQDSIGPSEKSSEDLQRDYVIAKGQPFDLKMVEARAITVEDTKIKVGKVVASKGEEFKPFLIKAQEY